MNMQQGRFFTINLIWCTLVSDRVSLLFLLGGLLLLGRHWLDSLGWEIDVHLQCIGLQQILLSWCSIFVFGWLSSKYCSYAPSWGKDSCRVGQWWKGLFPLVQKVSISCMFPSFSSSHVTAVVYLRLFTVVTVLHNTYLKVSCIVSLTNCGYMHYLTVHGITD